MLALNCILIFYVLFLIVNSENCPPHEGCVYDEKTALLTCRGHVNGTHKGVRHLHLCRYDNTTLFLSNIVKKVPSVKEVTISFSNLSFLIGPFMENNIEYLKINNSTLRRFTENLFMTMKKLKVVDLRNNSLDRLPVRIRHADNLQAIYLENNTWNCGLDMKWALNLSDNKEIFKDYEKLNCYEEPFVNKPIVAIAEFLENAQVNCPSYCECSLTNVIRDINNTEKLRPIVEANCSNKGLIDLPAALPNHTKILHLEWNLITDLTPLTHNKIYRNVLDLYLDHNRVESIENLEGARWLSRFSVLSLRRNRLTQLPTYALDNALEQNPNIPNAVRVFLGGNPWVCDCTFTPGFQQMLMKYESQIGDLEDIKCSHVPGDENSYAIILSLTRSSVCRPPSEYTIAPLDLLNIVLASLIVIILSKLAYDYYYFKRTGRLPWIVTKMP